MPPPKNISQEELQALKEEINELKSYIEELRDTLPTPFCAFSTEGVINDANKSLAELSGYKLLEIIGQPIELLFSDKKEIAELRKELRKRERIRERESILITKQKEKIPVSLSLSTRKDLEGNIVGYFTAITEITRIKEYQRELEEAKAVLEIKVEARTEKLKELAEGLENQVKQRTEELQEKVNELERFNRLAVGRELKMVELKKELKKLKEKLKKPKS